ncbi:hypothetical protein WCN65_15265, partial [Staphylococcus aureus]
ALLQNKEDNSQLVTSKNNLQSSVNQVPSTAGIAQTKIDQAKALLQNKEDNSQLVTSKNNLQSSVNQVPSTAGI